MSNMITSISGKLSSMDDKSIALAYEAEEYIASFEQVEMTTEHILHGGMYHRTILIKEGITISGALIKIPTTLIVNGECSVYIGDKVIECKGYGIIPAESNRKQIIHAIKDTMLTMSFPTKATTIREAEDEFTDESDRLMSRTPLGVNIIKITRS